MGSSGCTCTRLTPLAGGSGIGGSCGIGGGDSRVSIEVVAAGEAAGGVVAAVDRSVDDERRRRERREAKTAAFMTPLERTPETVFRLRCAASLLHRRA